MTDTSPAALKKLADEALCNTAFVPKSLLLAIAAEKEAQSKQEPFGFIDRNAMKNFEKDWADTATVYRRQGPDDNEDATVAVYLAPQHHPEQPLEMVAPADVPLPKVPFAWYWPSGCGKWFEVFVHAVAVKLMLPCGKPLYTADQLHQYAEAYAKAAVAAERERIKACLNGIDQSVLDDAGGWWPTRAGAEFGAGVLAAVLGQQKGTV